MQLYGWAEGIPRLRLAGHKISRKGHVSLIASPCNTDPVHRLCFNTLLPNVNLLFADQY